MAPGSDAGCGKNANGPRSLGPAVRTGTTRGPALYRTCRRLLLSVCQRPSKGEGHRGPPSPLWCTHPCTPAQTLPPALGPQPPLQSAEGIPDIHLKHRCPHQLLAFPHTCSPRPTCPAQKLEFSSSSGSGHNPWHRPFTPTLSPPAKPAGRTLASTQNPPAPCLCAPRHPGPGWRREPPPGSPRLHPHPCVSSPHSPQRNRT